MDRDATEYLRDVTELDREPGEAERPAQARTVFIKSFGCQMNVYDAGRMADALAPEGYREVSEPDGADLVILNTCHIRGTRHREGVLRTRAPARDEGGTGRRGRRR